MSAPVATPQHQAHRAARRPGRKPRTADADISSTAAAPSAPEPLRNPSPATGNTTKKNDNNNNNKAQHRRPSQATSKPQQDGKLVNNHYDKARATPTPMKPAAYAGSTFQQSPAASALPMPSFYSKSLPTASSTSLPAVIPESVSPENHGIVPVDDSPSKPEPTPCDFLFQAALQARATPRANSPATRSGNLSVPNGSPASRSPAPREGDPMFPFELDAANPGENGSAFATPFKDRIEAIRSTSTGGKSMHDDERKAKTEALKKFLMKSSMQENNNHNNFGSPVTDMNNPFNARAPNPRASVPPQAVPQVRSSSNPSTPGPGQDNLGRYTPQAIPPVSYPFPTPQTQTPKRPNSSRLRHVYGAQSEPEYAELSSDSAVTPPQSTSRRNTGQQLPRQYNAAAYPIHPQMPTHRAKPSAQQLEDDLRRVLKLDLAPRV